MIINRHSRSRTLYFDAPSARSAQKSGSHSVRSASSNPITPGLQIRSLRSFKSPIRCSGAAEYVKKQSAGWLKTNNISHHLRFVAHSADERRDPLATTAKSGRNRTMISLLTSDPHTGIQIIKNCRDRGRSQPDFDKTPPIAVRKNEYIRLQTSIAAGLRPRFFGRQWKFFSAAHQNCSGSGGKSGSKLPAGGSIRSVSERGLRSAEGG